MKSLTVLLGLLAAGLSSAQSEVEVIRFDEKINRVHITNTSGVTLVKGTSQSTAELKVGKVKVSKDICEFRYETRSGILYVDVRNRGFTGAGHCEINLELEVPASAQLEITTGSGHTEISGIVGSIQFRSGSGGVKVDSASQKVSGVTGSGTIEVLAKALKSNIDLDSGSGSIVLKLPKEAQPSVHFESGSGELANDFTANQDGSVKVHVRTGSGDLSVRAL